MKLTELQKQTISRKPFQLENNNIMYSGKTKKERTILGQFFTPANLTIQILEKLNCSYEEFISSIILDPTSGSGNLLAAALILGVNPNNIYGVEIDEEMAELCKDRLNKLCKALNKPEIKNEQIY